MIREYLIYILVTLLQITFIILKLTDVIKWNWLWILSPLWISFVFILIIFLLGLYLTKDMEVYYDRKR